MTFRYRRNSAESVREETFWMWAELICKAQGLTYEEFTSRSTSAVAGLVHLQIEDATDSVLLKRDFHSEYISLPEYIIEMRLVNYHQIKNKNNENL